MLLSMVVLWKGRIKVEIEKKDLIIIFEIREMLV